MLPTLVHASGSGSHRKRPGVCPDSIECVLERANQTLTLNLKIEYEADARNMSMNCLNKIGRIVQLYSQAVCPNPWTDFPSFLRSPLDGQENTSPSPVLALAFLSVVSAKGSAVLVRAKREAGGSRVIHAPESLPRNCAALAAGLRCTIKKRPAPEGVVFQHSFPGHKCPGSLRL